MRRALAVLGLALLGAAAPRADAQTVAIGVGGQLSADVGAEILVPVYADMQGAPGTKLGSYTLRLQWDPAVLQFAAAEPGVFGQPILGADSVGLGVLRVGGLSVDGLDGVFELFHARMRVLGNATTAVTLTVSEAVAAGSFANLTPFVTVVSGSYCPAAGRWGDLDADGLANSRDALAILSAVVGLPVDPAFTLALGDVDGDGIVNSRDALITLSHAVGLAIPGQRVLVYAPGACGSGGPLGISLLPDTVDVAVNQYTRLLVTGTLGGQPAGANVSWSVGNPEIAVVSTEGVLAGRSAGTTTVTAALGPGVTATVPVIVRARRINWYVDAARAPLAGIQLGTQRYPFATPQYAFPVAQDGDTIRIAPGVHDYLGGEICTGGYYGDSPPADGPPVGSPPPEWCAYYGDVTTDIVLWGDTLPDGTRPVLRGNPDNQSMVRLYGGVRFRMRHLVARGFDQVIEQNDPTRSISVENVLFDVTGRQSYTAVALYYGVDTLVLRNVQIVGDSTYSSYALDVDGAAGVVVLDRVVVDGTRYGVYVWAVDSLDIRDSDIRPSLYEALTAEGSGLGARIYLARNRFLGVSDATISLFDVRSVVSERNVYRMGGDYYGPEVYGRDYPPQPGSRFISLGDSVIAEALTGTVNYGFYVDDLDTIRLDSAVVTGPDSGFTLYPGYLYGGAEVRVRGSRFLNVSGTDFYVAGRSIEVSNSAFTGCRAGCPTAYGIYAEGYVDSLALLQVTNNTFFRLYNAVDAPQYGEVHRAVITGNTMDSTYQAVAVYADTVLITDNALPRTFGGSWAMYVGPRYPRPSAVATVARNQVTAVGGYGLYGTGVHLTSSGNRYTGSAYGVYLPLGTASTWQLAMDRDTIAADSGQGGYGLYLSGTLNASVRRSRILGGGTGLYAALSGATLVLDSNVVSGSRTNGIFLSSTAGTSATGRWNNVTDNRTYGVTTSGPGTFTFTAGRFVLNQSRAVYAMSGSSVDASGNWWGAAAGPGPGTGGDSVFGSVTTTGFLTGDPLGVSVPPLAPPAGAFVADLWRAPVGVRRNPPATTLAPPEPPGASDDRVERAAKRAALRAGAENRIRERRAELERRRAEHQRTDAPRP